MAELKPYRGGYYLWQYVPSLAAAVIFLLIFLALSILHTYRFYKTRTWFCIPFALGGFFEIYGFGGRIGANHNTSSLFSYALSNDGVLLAPALFAASIYMTLGRLIRALHAEKFSFLRLNWTTRAFVIGDILSFVVQGSSVGLSVTGHPTGAKAVILIGLFIQMISFGLFAATAVIFYRRILRSPTPACFNTQIPWGKILYMLFGVSTLIMIRSLFRVIEYWMGNSGYLLQHEWTMYIFDSVPMVAVMVIFYIWYPSRIHDSGMRDSQREPLGDYGRGDVPTVQSADYRSLR